MLTRGHVAQLLRIMLYMQLFTHVSVCIVFVCFVAFKVSVEYLTAVVPSVIIQYRTLAAVREVLVEYSKRYSNKNSEPKRPE